MNKKTYEKQALDLISKSSNKYSFTKGLGKGILAVSFLLSGTVFADIYRIEAKIENRHKYKPSYDLQVPYSTDSAKGHFEATLDTKKKTLTDVKLRFNFISPDLLYKEGKFQSAIHIRTGQKKGFYEGEYEELFEAEEVGFILDDYLRQGDFDVRRNQYGHLQYSEAKASEIPIDFFYQTSSYPMVKHPKDKNIANYFFDSPTKRISIAAKFKKNRTQLVEGKIKATLLEVESEFRKCWEVVKQPSVEHELFVSYLSKIRSQIVNNICIAKTTSKGWVIYEPKSKNNLQRVKRMFGKLSSESYKRSPKRYIKFFSLSQLTKVLNTGLKYEEDLNTRAISKGKVHNGIVVGDITFLDNSYLSDGGTSRYGSHPDILFANEINYQVKVNFSNDAEMKEIILNSKEPITIDATIGCKSGCSQATKKKAVLRSL